MYKYKLLPKNNVERKAFDVEFWHIVGWSYSAEELDKWYPGNGPAARSHMLLAHKHETYA